MASRRPRSIIVAAAVTIVMASGIAGVAIWDLIAGDTTGPRLGTNAYYVIVAALLVPASLALLAGRAWPRAILVTAHLLVILSMIAMARLLTWFAVLVAVLSVTSLVALATPSARAHLGARRARFLED